MRRGGWLSLAVSKWQQQSPHPLCLCCCPNHAVSSDTQQTVRHESESTSIPLPVSLPPQTRHQTLAARRTGVTRSLQAFTSSPVHFLSFVFLPDAHQNSALTDPDVPLCRHKSSEACCSKRRRERRPLQKQRERDAAKEGEHPFLWEFFCRG